jgi:hypothetical protein
MRYKDSRVPKKIVDAGRGMKHSRDRTDVGVFYLSQVLFPVAGCWAANMARLSGVPEATFTALQHIRETSLIRFDSLFTPSGSSGVPKNLRQFHALFVERFDEGEGSFLEKWQKQLAGAGDDIFRLAAELLYVQQFFTSVTGPENKLENVRVVLTWCKQPPSIPEWAVEGLSWGLARDQSFNQHRPFHLAWLNEYLIHWQDKGGNGFWRSLKLSVIIEPCAGGYRNRHHQQEAKVHLPVLEF